MKTTIALIIAACFGMFASTISAATPLEVNTAGKAVVQKAVPDKPAVTNTHVQANIYTAPELGAWQTNVIAAEENVAAIKANSAILPAHFDVACYTAGAVTIKTSALTAAPTWTHFNSWHAAIESPPATVANFAPTPQALPVSAGIGGNSA